jgi:hypothetical protein
MESYDQFGGEDDPFSWAERSSAIKVIVNEASRCYCFLFDVLDECTTHHSALSSHITRM